MTVRELIAALQQHDPEAEALVGYDGSQSTRIVGVCAAPGLRHGGRVLDCRDAADVAEWEDYYRILEDEATERVAVVVVRGE